MERRIGEVSIVVEQGDITRISADAIVNAANSFLWMGGGVAGAIKRAGGDEIEREAVAQGPIDVGAAVATTAGRLPAKHVIHAATMGQDLATGAEAIRAATRASVRLADAMGLSSIALPLLGTGVGGYDQAAAAALMVEEILAAMGGAASLRRVLLVGFDAAAAKAFERALEGSGR